MSRACAACSLAMQARFAPLSQQWHAIGYDLHLVIGIARGFATLGADAWTLEPKAFDAYIREEIRNNAALVKAAGLEVQK